MARKAPEIILTPNERRQLEVWSRLKGTSLARRASMILAAANGYTNLEIAGAMRVKPGTVGLWRRHFAENRLHGIQQNRVKRGAGTPKTASNTARRVLNLAQEKHAVRHPSGSHVQALRAE